MIKMSQFDIIKGNTLDILLIEDDPVWINLFSSVLRAQTPEISLWSAKSIKQAENFVRKKRFKLIIADYQLQGQDTGLDFWASLKRQKLSNSFILTSSISNQKLIASLSGQRAPIFIHKTIVVKNLGALVKYFLSLS